LIKNPTRTRPARPGRHRREIYPWTLCGRDANGTRRTRNAQHRPLAWKL